MSIPFRKQIQNICEPMFQEWKFSPPRQRNNIVNFLIFIPLWFLKYLKYYKSFGFLEEFYDAKYWSLFTELIMFYFLPEIFICEDFIHLWNATNIYQYINIQIVLNMSNNII